jgi:hypothetical protein
MDEFVNFNDAHIKVAKAASGKIEAKESGVLRHLRAAIDGFESPIALLFPPFERSEVR